MASALITRAGLAVVGGIGGFLTAGVVRQKQDFPTNPFHVFKALGDSAAPRKPKRRAIVIGGGVVGVSTAYELSQRGFQVALLENQGHVAPECSQAPAGGMQRMNHVVDKHTWIKTFKNLLPWASDKYFLMSWTSTLTDPHFLRWLAEFSYTSLALPSKEREHREAAMLDFTNYAIDAFVALLTSSDERRKASAFSTNGALNLCVGEQGIAEARARGATWPGMKDCEPNRSVIDRAALLDLEPWLAQTAGTQDITGAVYQADAARGNSPWASEVMEQLARDNGVEFVYNTKVLGFEVQLDQQGPNKRVCAIHTSRGTVAVDTNTQIVVAAGSWTPLILRKLDLFASIYPMKGYSLLVDVGKRAAEASPQRIVSYKKLFLARYHDELRVSGLGQFSGWQTGISEDIKSTMRRDAKALLPGLSEEIDKGYVLTGLRPYAADALLLLGQAPEHSNVFINVGPGFNGWKNALGTGRLLALMMDRGVDAELGVPFDVSVFDPRLRVKVSPLFVGLCNLLRPNQGTEYHKPHHVAH
eukprot:m.249885 g.249885  ORF g.249885 m.249885 type:complete len:530 (+) comp19092_c0_seq1:2084-3673(+)